MLKTNGIKTVEFYVEAEGENIVNWNTNFSIKKKINKNNTDYVNNHMFPPLRSYLNEAENKNGIYDKKFITNFDPKKTPLYVSQNCIRFNLYKDEKYITCNIKNKKDVSEMLASLTGLTRGYLIQNLGFRRTSCLYISDFNDTLHNLNYEQFTKQSFEDVGSEKVYKSNSFFSKFTAGKTRYIAKGFINIEELQFICLDNRYGRMSAELSPSQIGGVKENIENYIKSLDITGEKTPRLSFSKNYKRFNNVGRSYLKPEAGFVLNDDAMDILVNELLERIRGLQILRTGGYMNVTNLDVFYNSTPTIFTGKEKEKKEKYFEYYVEG